MDQDTLLDLALQSNQTEASEEELFKILKENVTAGKNKLLQTVARELMLVDDSWINTIEEYLASLEKIVRNPKTFIIDARELVPVEKARRVDGVSIRYLASHSEDVRRIDKRGNVEPVRILAKSMQEELSTYENRVVYTLIQRLKVFVEERYQNIKDTIANYETTNLQMESKFKLGKAIISYKLDMDIKQRKTKAESGQEILERLKTLRRRLMILNGTPFCKTLASTKLITPPLQRTNLLAGNVDYNNIYKLWLYISAYRAIGYSVTSSVKKLPFDNDYYDDLTDLVAESLKVLIHNNILRRNQYANVKFRNKKVKQYTTLQKSALDTDAGEQYNKLVLGGDGINQYYYEKMRSLVKSISKKSTAKDVEDIKRINANFRRFYKGLAKINNALLFDIMKMGAEERFQPSPGDSVLKKRQLELRKQKEIYKKYKLLVELKEAELESLKTKELSIKQKMHKLEVDVDARLYKEKQKKIEKTKRVSKKKTRKKMKLKELISE
ncbi:MAG: DUF2357 domain-containing protein [Clostridia bacterium]|nr:DUF2357 domain-containing protein [Clostridia bacterium]